MRKIFLDCGAYNGCSVELFTKMYDDYEEYEVFSFEANRGLSNQIISTAKKYKFKNFTLINEAVWISSGIKYFVGSRLVDLYNDTDDATLVKSYEEITLMHEQEQTDTGQPRGNLQTLDFSKFILDNFDKNDYIILKMDIEGAEYKVIDKMFNDDSLKYISKFYGELHGTKKGFNQNDTNKFFKQIYSNNLRMFNWDSMQGEISDLEIVPNNTENSFDINGSCNRLCHSYKKIED